MTGTETRTGHLKTAIAAFAILYAVAALAALATATTGGGRSALERLGAAGFLEQSPLGR
ncbi:hypothetical protein [Chenggangzhangella methanolivorans]|uniref:Uncharacterized protein n=1 Tax=Chenggangzhangella methanolivorans TaxID=1437009 RepID=A0A9E6UMG3_9HYPH|nr:hypothetical protein [Chenggangzhangella methanolivorans]QZO00001.1 hypothetical protein K6K41_25955 [Chenggangzhangella methanolivorans]